MTASVLMSAMFVMSQLLRGNRGEMPSRQEFMDAAAHHLYSVEPAAQNLDRIAQEKVATLLGAFYEYTVTIRTV